MPKKLTGLGNPSFKQLSQKMSLSKRHSLQSSACADVRELWADSSSQHVVVDELLVSHDSITAASKALTKHQQQTATDHLFGLQLQGVIPKCVSETIENKNRTVGYNDRLPSVSSI